MSREGLVQNNMKRLVLSERYAKRRKDLAASIKSEPDPDKKQALIRKLDALPRNSSLTRFRNRCSITGRPRGYSRYTGLCRIVSRNYIAQGLLPGFVRGRVKG